MKTDGHIHTSYCPHGTKDSFYKYIERAISKNFSEITFTEHAPLPSGFTDPTPHQDSGMKLDLLEKYIEELSEIKQEFRGQIKINIGLEVDFIEGFELETKDFLNKYGPLLDDSILSVHFLKLDDTYYCMDYCPNTFEEMIVKSGTIQSLYEKYYQTLLLSIKSDLGTFKPKRIGHITLVRKFQKKFPIQFSDKEFIMGTLEEVNNHNLQLDCNSAGLYKPLCKESYPPIWALQKAIEMDIPLVYGSDAHQASMLGKGYETFNEIKLASPTASLPSHE